MIRKIIKNIYKAKWYIFLILSANICCTNKEDVLKYSFLVSYYKLGYAEIKNKDTMYVVREKKNNNSIFKYKCSKIKEGVDLFEINNDSSVYYNNIQVVKVDIKNLKFKDSTIVVEKYINLNTTSPHGLTDIYFNRKHGLILVKNLVSNNIVEYDTNKFEQIHNKIISDTLLFKDSKEIISKVIN